MPKFIRLLIPITAFLLSTISCSPSLVKNSNTTKEPLDQEGSTSGLKHEITPEPLNDGTQKEPLRAETSGLRAAATPDPVSKTLILYPKALSDPRITELFWQPPVHRKEVVSGSLVFEQITPSRIAVSLFVDSTDKAQQRFSMFDVVKYWTGLIKTQPANGAAWFKNVKGIDEFIKGREAVIPGISIVGQAGAVVSLTKPDSQAINRLCSPDLVPRQIRRGSYKIASTGVSTGRFVLIKNNTDPNIRTCTDTVEFDTTRQSNPVTAWAKNQSATAVVLKRVADLERARTILGYAPVVTVLGEDRYFLAVHPQRSGFGSWLKAKIDIEDLICIVLGVQGKAIPSILGESVAKKGDLLKTTTEIIPQVTDKPYVIMYKETDPFAEVIATKCVTLANDSNVKCHLSALSSDEFERRYYTQDYDIAVGSIDGKVISDVASKALVPAFWFGDSVDESSAIASYRIIPLCSVKRFLYQKKPNCHIF